MSNLPLTHFDRIRKLRPELWRYLDKEAVRLNDIGWKGAVHSVDDIESPFFESYITVAFNQHINDLALKTNIPSEIIEREFKQSVHAKLLLQSLNQDYHTLLNFEFFSKKTFYFFDCISENLLGTELNIQSEMIRLPFDSCLLVFQGNAVIDALAHGFPEWKLKTRDYAYPISVFVTSHPDKTQEGCRKILMSISHWHGDELNLLIKREVSIRPKWSLEESLRTDWELLGEVEGGGFFLSNDGDAKKIKDEQFYTDGLSFFRLILNSLLYLSSSDPDIIEKLSGREMALNNALTIKSSIKSKVARKEARKISELNYSSIGESTKSIYIRKGELDSKKSPLGSFREYAIRFLVRGHWRNQACGFSLTEYRLTWIKPYYKGSEISQLVNKPYLVK